MAISEPSVPTINTNMSETARQYIKRGVRRIVPLGARKQVCIHLNRQRWIRSETRSWWTTEMLRDFQESDINGYHKFLWAHHLGYALPYEASSRFGRENIPASRRIFFSDLTRHLASIGVDAGRDIRSVLEIGCSLGYQLRHVETDVAPSAGELVGIDIDAYAVSEGKRFLQRVGSKVELISGEMGDMDRLLGTKRFDLIFSTGVLMYLHETEAARIVDAMIRRSRILVAITGPAHPEIDNRLLAHSVARRNDNSFIHNIDSMLQKTGTEILGRRWEGNKIVEGHTLYSVFAKGARES
jgi:SAM-dependent methyltransferase